jgi:hypothetical protein
MTKNQALKTLINHQKWRLGSDRVKMTGAKELTEALNIAIDFMKESKKDAKTMEILGREWDKALKATK